MEFHCKSTSGCTLARHGISGECLASQLHNPRLCELSDPQSKDYSTHYEEYLNKGKLEQDIQKREGTKVVDEMLMNENILTQINTCKYRSCSCKGAKCSLNPLDVVNVDYNACKDCIMENRRPIDPELLPDPSKGFGGNLMAKASKPNLISRAASLAKAIASHVAAGLPVATDEQAEHRLKICRSCPLIDPDNILGEVCNKCGCVLAIKTKMGNESCPLDPPRWSTTSVAGSATSSAGSTTSSAGSAKP